MLVKISKLEEKFEEFKKFILDVSGSEFTSFDNKYIDENENYKKQVYNIAIDKLKVTSWKEEHIGSGRILDLILKAIDTEKNNLLIHDNRRGVKARQDYQLIKASKDMARKNKE